MDQQTKLAALAKYLDVEAVEVEPVTYDDSMFDVGQAQYLVLTGEEGSQRVCENIKESLWTFSTSFIANYVPALRDSGARDAFAEMQNKLCESANDLVAALIGERFEEFCEDAVSADGAAHFLNTYDDQEHKVVSGTETLFIYRVN